MQYSSQSNSAIQPYYAFLRETCSGERDYVSIPPKKGQVLAYKKLAISSSVRTLLHRLIKSDEI